MDYTIRHDRGTIKQKHLTAEGFLKVDAIFTRTGVFDYVNNDGTPRKELRHPEEVFKDDSLKSMEMLPITFLHPKERVVDSENAKKLQVGFTGERIHHDGGEVYGTVLITDKKAITAIENDGVEELSLGYQVKLIKDEGEFQGKRFDYRQTEIVYNHLAIVPRGRAGVAKMILDAADAVQSQTNQDSNPKKEELTIMTMVKKNLDGIQYEAAPEIVNALDKAIARADAAEGSLQTATDATTKLQASFDDVKGKLDTAEKVDHSKAVNDAVAARMSLLGAALRHLNKDEAKEIELKSDSEIQELVIKKYSPNFNKDGADAENIKSDVYMKARFDAALENTPANNDNKGGKGIQGQREQANQNNNDSGQAEGLEKARNDYQEDLTSAWKPKTTNQA